MEKTGKGGQASRLFHDMDSDRRFVAVHMGALGDFLLIWPALLSVARHVSSEGSGSLYWCGKSSHSRWAEAAGWRGAPPELRRGVEALYTAESWPGVLENTAVLWLGLSRRPTSMRDDHLWFIPCVQQGERSQSPRLVARAALEASGIAWSEDWREVFRACFGKWGAEPFEYDALLFPGAGHRAKHWHLERFARLSLRLQDEGARVAFVLGPAEVERGLDPLAHVPVSLRSALRVLSPGSLEELSSLLLRTRSVLGNDCGPMHLAGMHGTPGVVLFGPTSRRQWAPEGLSTLVAGVECRPCSTTTAGIECASMACMEGIGEEEVFRALAPFALA